MGKVADWLFGAVDTAGSSPAVSAAAARVALSTSRRTDGWANTPWTFGPPLAPFTVPDEWAGFNRDAMMSLPTVARGRELLCSTVGALPLTLWTTDPERVPTVEQQVKPASWMYRPDPAMTRDTLLQWTTDDLIFYGVSHWLITRRAATSFPLEFRRLWPGSLDVTDDGRAFVQDPPGSARREVDPADIVEFLSGGPGVLCHGWRSVSIAMQLDAAAERFAAVEVPAGVLEEQESAEDSDGTYLDEMTEKFNRARLLNVTAATNKHVRYREVNWDASRMQLVEGREYQALELARLMNVPPYLVGAPAGTGMTYLNGQQAREDLVDFGAAPHIRTIEQTLSAPNVTPRGQFVRLDMNAWLRNPLNTSGVSSPNDMEIADPTGPTPNPPAEVPQ